MPHNKKITNVSILQQQYLNQKHSKPNQYVPVKQFCGGHHDWFLVWLLIGVLAGSIILSSVITAYLLQSKKVSTLVTDATSTTVATTVAKCFVLPSPHPSNIWLLVGNMSTARYYHTSTLMSQDNSVLIAGGHNINPVASVEKYIPSTGCFQMIGSMSLARYSHTATELSLLSGFILLAGGYTSQTYADLFDTKTGISVKLSLTSQRHLHTATVLNPSKFVLIGGMNGSATSNSAEQFTVGSPSSFSSIPSTMAVSRSDHTATRLGNTSNLILIAGGRDIGTYYSSATIFDASSSTFIAVSTTMLTARSSHTATYLPMPIHKVLMTDGTYDGWARLNTLSLFDATTLSFINITNTMYIGRIYHTATLLPNGKVLIIRGYSVNMALADCELIDLTNNVFSSTLVANLTIARYSHTATLFTDNGYDYVLVCGGSHHIFGPLNSCEIYFI